MKTPSELYLQLHKFSPNPLANAMSKNRKLTVLGLAAYMRKTKEIESLRLALAFTILGCKPTELDQPRFVLMQFQVESQKTLPKVSQEPFSVLAVLKADHKVIAKPDDDNITTGMLCPPLVCPQIKHVMKINIGKQGTYTSTLRYAFFIMCHRALFKHACIEPLLNVSQDVLVRNPVLNEFHQPFVGDGIKRYINLIPLSTTRLKTA